MSIDIVYDATTSGYSRANRCVFTYNANPIRLKACFVIILVMIFAHVCYNWLYWAMYTTTMCWRKLFSQSRCSFHLCTHGYVPIAPQYRGQYCNALMYECGADSRLASSQREMGLINIIGLISSKQHWITLVYHLFFHNKVMLTWD